MAREPAITQEQVNAAADRIRAGGAKPTARAIREALGVGSMATVLKFLQVWQAGQVRPPEASVQFPMGLQRTLTDFIAQEVASAKLDLEKDLVLAQQTNADLIAESERLAGQVESLGDALERAQADKAELSGRLTQLTVDLESARADALQQREQAETARTECAKLSLRLEGVPRLEADVERLRTVLAQEQHARTAAEQTAAVAQAKEAGALSQLQDLQARLKLLETDHRDAAQELSGLRAWRLSAQDALRTAEQDKANALGQAKTAQEEAATLRGQLVELREQRQREAPPENPSA
jgi:chromosome segregation ATPase